MEGRQKATSRLTQGVKKSALDSDCSDVLEAGRVLTLGSASPRNQEVIGCEILRQSINCLARKGKLGSFHSQTPDLRNCQKLSSSPELIPVLKSLGRDGTWSKRLMHLLLLYYTLLFNISSPTGAGNPFIVYVNILYLLL